MTVHRINSVLIETDDADTFFEPLRREKFIADVAAKLDFSTHVAVPITDDWRKQIEPGTLAQFMNDNPGCRLGLVGEDITLYVPDEDRATMARLSL